jgi:hypothetical protein
MIDRIWKEVDRGKMTEKEARTRIMEYAEGFRSRGVALTSLI